MTGKDIGFSNQPLGDMVAVGATDAVSARIWTRVAAPGELDVRWKDAEGDNGHAVMTIDESNARDNTGSVLISGLKPLRQYRFEVVRAADGHKVGEGRFETTPQDSRDTPGRFAIGLMSCHQPFDDDGRVMPGARQMLRATRQCLRSHNTKLVLQVGDQVYSDLPLTRSLFDENYFGQVAPPGRQELLECTPQETRRLYQERYRYFFAVPEWKALNAEFPCYPILDDHDIVDNWGSDPAHQERRWRNVIEGARAAYFDYQGSRLFSPGDGLPNNFDYDIEYGDTAVHIVDMRSNRRAGEGAQVISESQMQGLAQFLEHHAGKQAVFLVISVPPVHLPRPMARVIARLRQSGEDFSDRWSSGKHVRDRDRMFRILRDHQIRHPEQHLAILSGDIHIGCLHRVEWVGGGAFHQMISSAITHFEGPFIRHGSRAIIRMKRRLRAMDGSFDARARLVKGEKGAQENPCAHLNLGVIDIRTPPDGRAPEVHYHLYGHDNGEPRLLFRACPALATPACTTACQPRRSRR